MVHRSYEYIGLSWACLKAGLPMAYLLEVWGSTSTFPTKDEILQHGEEYCLLHYAGHLHAKDVQKKGLLFTDTNKKGEKYIVEPCLRAALTMQRRIVKAFGLVEAASSIANSVKVIWDAKPWCLHNKNSAEELGENLDRYPDVLYWLQRVHWLVMSILFPYAKMGAVGAAITAGAAACTAVGLKRMLTVGVGTNRFFHASIYTTKAGDLGINIGLFFKNVTSSIVHPMRWWLGITFDEFKQVLLGFSVAFGNTRLNATIMAMTEDDINDSFGNRFSFLLGTTIVVTLPTGLKFLISSARGLARAIGCDHKTVLAWACETSKLEEKFGAPLAAKYRKQMAQDKENLESGAYLGEYVKGSEASKERKSKRKVGQKKKPRQT